MTSQNGQQTPTNQPNRVARAQANAISESDAQRSSLIFKALGDATRLKLAVALMSGPICVGDLAAYLEVGQSAVSHHLRVLRNLALVKSRRDRQTLFYSLSDHHVEDLIRICLEHVREGDAEGDGG